MSTDKQAKTTLSGVIDRFEENMAVLLIGDDEVKVNFPKKLLPPSLEEGDWLKIDIAYDDETTAQMRREIEELSRSIQAENE